MSLLPALRSTHNLTPLRRLEGISYWVIESEDQIYEFINTNIKKEIEADQRHTFPLQALGDLTWKLEIMALTQLSFDPEVTECVDLAIGYNFKESLSRRIQALREAIEVYDTVIWPLVVLRRGLRLVDGYCRQATLRAMNISKSYAYVGYDDSKPTGSASREENKGITTIRKTTS